MSDELERNAAGDVDEVMKKYDRESNVRIWTGKPAILVKAVESAV